MQIYNTLTRAKEPLENSEIGFYVCGPTVYDVPHLGHARSAYVFDMIRRYLGRVKKRDITFVRNVTDVDDKIIQKAVDELSKENAPAEGEALSQRVLAVSKKYLDAYHEAMLEFGILPPDHEPKATETIAEMVEFIQALINRGYAYEAGGSVYFEVRKFADYGRLSGQSIDEMEEGARVSVEKEKKDPLDFALWKKVKENEPFWPSPWGNGRPGWHIECSVMSTRLLGDKFLIHGGGLDLVFPHHENEIAQTVCAGKLSAKFWIHNGLLTINGQKMSKSLGNYITLGDFKAKYGDLDLLKMLFLHSHYRHPVDYTEQKIESIKHEKARIKRFLERAKKELAETDIHPSGSSGADKLFSEGMDEDFNTPFALGLLFDRIEEGNRIIDKSDKTQKDLQLISDYAFSIEYILKQVFGLELKDEDAVSEQVAQKIREREEARKNKDFKKADALRQEISKMGFTLEDAKDGTVWRKNI